MVESVDSHLKFGKTFTLLLISVKERTIKLPYSNTNVLLFEVVISNTLYNLSNV